MGLTYKKIQELAAESGLDSPELFKVWMLCAMHDPRGILLDEVLDKIDRKKLLHMEQEIGCIEFDEKTGRIHALPKGKWKTKNSPAAKAAEKDSERSEESFISTSDLGSSNTSREKVDSTLESTRQPTKFSSEPAKGKQKKTSAPRKKSFVGSGPLSPEAILEAFENPNRAVSKKVIKAMVDRTFRLINDHRVSKGSTRMAGRVATKYEPLLRRIAFNVAEGGVDLRQFLDFAVERADFIKANYPPLKLLGGDWLWSEWEQWDGPKASRHAGKQYTGEALADGASGTEEIDDAMKRWLVGQAKLLNKAPHLYSPDPEWDETVREIAGRLKS